MVHRFQVKLLHSNLTQHLKWTLPTNSMYKTAKQLESLIVLKSQQSKCQTNWRRFRQLQLPNFQLPTVSIFSSRFTRLYKSPLISIFTDLSFVQGFLHNGPTGFLWVTNLSCCILKPFYHVAIPKLNHLALCKGFHTWFYRVLGRWYFWKCSKPNDFSRRLSMSGSAIPKRLLFKRFRLQWQPRQWDVTGLPVEASTICRNG